MRSLNYAPQVYKALNGIFCIYKPPGISMRQVKATFKMRLTNDLNSMPDRPLRRMVQLNEENLGTNLPIVTAVPDLSDHPQVIGPRYLQDDISVDYALHLQPESSGLVVCGIGSGCEKLRHIKKSELMRVHHVQGQLGMATQDFIPTGHLVEKTTWRHVKQGHIDRIVAGIQANHQKYMFIHAGIDLQTQDAYEMAQKGIIRPKDESIPIIYGVKCIEFEPPHFKLEIHSIGESCKYFRQIIHEIGLQLKSSAVCSKLQRIRVGHFTLDHALLQRHWKCEGVVSNIDLCAPMMKRELFESGLYLRQLQTTDKLELESGVDKYLDQVVEADDTIENEDLEGIY